MYRRHSCRRSPLILSHFDFIATERNICLKIIKFMPEEIPPSAVSGSTAVPPLLAASEPPVIGGQGLVPPQPPGKGFWRARHLVAVVLSFALGLFLTDALISAVDDSFILLFKSHFLGGLRGIVGFFTVVIGLVLYALMGITPTIPKRKFILVALFSPLAALLALPFWIYFYGRMQIVMWAISVFQLICAVMILGMVQGGFKFRMPLVSEERLNPRGFSWLNLGGFVLVNALVLLPAVAAYLFFCGTLAVGHFSEGFVALHPGGLSVQVRKYVRNDGKSVHLYPMAHVADRNFYQTISQSFPTNSLVLMEGVTDREHLLTNHITYTKMAATLGLSEQQKEFKPSEEQMERADVDIKEFTPNTIGFLNVVMRIHSKGLNAASLMELMTFSPPPGFEKELFDDLLRKRNRHLLDEVQRRLPETDNIVVPWGAAHMPEIARELQKDGFQLKESRDYTVIRFGDGGKISR
jgi:hypothetical protein